MRDGSGPSGPDPPGWQRRVHSDRGPSAGSLWGCRHGRATHLHFVMHGQWSVTPSRITGLWGSRWHSRNCWRDGQRSRGTAPPAITSAPVVRSARAFCSKLTQDRVAARMGCLPLGEGISGGRPAVPVAAVAADAYHHHGGFHHYWFLVTARCVLFTREKRLFNYRSNVQRSEALSERKASHPSAAT